jgi:hypothetical protein
LCLLGSNWPHSVFGQNYLFVKMLFYKGFRYSEVVQMFLHCFQDRRFQSPCQPSGRRVIPSGRPSVHCSIRSDGVSHRPDDSTDQASTVRTTCILVWTFIVSRSHCTSLHPSGRLSSPSWRLSVIEQLQILSKFNLREDCFNRSDDVDSRPDTLIHKARIAIQISPSERQSALVRTRIQQLRKLPIRLQPFGRLPIMVLTRA